MRAVRELYAQMVHVRTEQSYLPACSPPVHHSLHLDVDCNVHGYNNEHCFRRRHCCSTSLTVLPTDFTEPQHSSVLVNLWSHLLCCAKRCIVCVAFEDAKRGVLFGQVILSADFMVTAIAGGL